MTAPGSFAPEPPGRSDPPAPGSGAPAGAVPTGGFVPVPPPGPGVQPPFAAPPTEGDRRRLWLGLGAGGLALLLCCVGGLVGVGALLVTTVQAVNEQAQKTVSNYLDALRSEEYADAYELLCDSARRAESLDEFERRVAREPRIASFDVAEPKIADRVVVPAQVRFADGDVDTLRFVLEQDTRTGAFEVCGFDE
ncbi:MAG TPA: hypothetical protein VFM55_19690 [Micromonosporaceae bacterium]|nr:hypothetical protein [Micromonosporaceae bacterium]